MPRIYVGNLASSVTTQDLVLLFSRAGEVRAALAITDKTSGLCRGFGFIDMVDAEDAIVAASLLNGTQLKEQPIDIQQLTPRSNGTARNPRQIKRVLETYRN